MSSPPNSSLQSTTDTDANIHTKHASSFVSPNSSLLASSGDISSNGAIYRDPSDDDMRPRNTPTAAETPTSTALQIAEERHAREIQELKEKHTQDLEALREELKCAHGVEIIELKMALYAEHKRDLLELKEERERGLEHLKTFFLAVRAREESVACSPTLSPAGTMGELRSTCPAALVEASGPAPASTSAANSTATTTSLPTSPKIPTSSNTTSAPTSPTANSNTNAAPSSPDTPAIPTAPHVHFLTTGITAADAKRAIEAKKATGEGPKAGRVRHEFGDKWVKSAMKVVVKVREGGKGGAGEESGGKGE